ncbi:hypothetical protein L9F63_022407, partial [Diploptera punctata]
HNPKNLLRMSAVDVEDVVLVGGAGLRFTHFSFLRYSKVWDVVENRKEVPMSSLCYCIRTVTSLMCK